MTRTCPACGEDAGDATWDVDVTTSGSVADGRLRLSDVRPVAYLGCGWCSETLMTLDADAIAAVLAATREEGSDD